MQTSLESTLDTKIKEIQAEFRTSSNVMQLSMESNLDAKIKEIQSEFRTTSNAI